MNEASLHQLWSEVENSQIGKTQDKPDRVQTLYDWKDL